MIIRSLPKKRELLAFNVSDRFYSELCRAAQNRRNFSVRRLPVKNQLISPYIDADTVLVIEQSNHIDLSEGLERFQQYGLRDAISLRSDITPRSVSDLLMLDIDRIGILNRCDKLYPSHLDALLYRLEVNGLGFAGGQSANNRLVELSELASNYIASLVVGFTDLMAADYLHCSEATLKRLRKALSVSIGLKDSSRESILRSLGDRSWSFARPTKSLIPFLSAKSGKPFAGYDFNQTSEALKSIFWQDPMTLAESMFSPAPTHAQVQSPPEQTM
jgi:hypothetical protein